ATSAMLNVPPSSVFTFTAGTFLLFPSTEEGSIFVALKANIKIAEEKRIILFMILVFHSGIKIQTTTQ
ncbi:MAG TPA: hypothetical protein DEP18_07060, partial [Flavobacteriales bacterium]|nr:hypothetical protein [Flavobacteriales bacterium]